MKTDDRQPLEFRTEKDLPPWLVRFTRTYSVMDVALLAILVSILVSLWVVQPEAAPATTPLPAFDLDIFQAMFCVQPESPPERQCYVERRVPPAEFLDRALRAASDAGATDEEMAEMTALWLEESSHKWIQPVPFMTDPEYAGQVCLRLYRETVERCHGAWKCCYQHGVSGCRRRGGVR